MKKIIGLVLSLVLLTSVFAVLPTMAADDVTITDVAVHLDQGITLIYKLSDGGYEYVPVAAKEMNKVAAPAGYTEGTTSVKAYAAKLLGMEDTSDITKALVNAMLNYGAAAQNYFGYETDNLVGTPVTDTAALEAAVAPDVVVNDDEGIYLGASLILEGTLKLRFYFEGNDLEVEHDNNTPAVTNVGDICYLDVPFMPYDVAESITVTTGTTSVSYAPINYLKAKVNDADEKLTTMVASIYAYSVAARTYYIEYNCEHKGITLNTVVVPTLFTEGLAQGACPLCGDEVSKKLEKTEAQVITVTNTTEDEHLIKESVRLGDVLADGQHFYPTTDNPDGNSLYIEFSMLLNSSLANFVGTNFSFPGIYTSEVLSSDRGHSAFWFYFKNDAVDGINKGAFDDWGSNKVAGTTYTNNTPVLADDGWHRIAVKFHQNDTIDYENKSVKSTMTVIMYVDGVNVYEATLGNGSKPAKQELLLYTAEFDGDKVVYTDLVNSYAAYLSFNAYVTDANNPAHVILADKHVTVGNSGFVLNAANVANPEEQSFTSGDITLSGKMYYAVKDLSNCYAGDHTWAENATVDVAATCTTNGQKSIKCTVCGETNADSIEVIPAAHTWAENATVDVAATCTTNGSESIKCTVCKATKPDSTVTIPATGHKGVPVITVPTFFSEGYEQGNCTTCGAYVDGIMAKTEVEIETVTTNVANKHIIRESERLGDILEDGQHFYPTSDNEDGNSLYVEFSILLNETMDNLKSSDISFPGIYTNEYLDPEYGHSAFWFFIRNGDADKGKCDDWTSNAIKELGYYNNQTALAFDGWHRIGVKFHQNDTIDYDNKTVKSTMTVTMYYDGVRVYEATLGNGTKPEGQELLLYTAKFDGDEVVYTDCVDSYAAFYTVNAYVASNGTTANIIIADKYATCGNDGFVLDVIPVTNPAAQNFTQGNVTVSGKQYFEVKGPTDCELGNHNWANDATVDTPATCTTPGSKSIKCIDCDAVMEGSEMVIPATGHSGLELTVVPTVFTTGLMSGTCSTCGEAATEVVETTKANMNAVTTTTKDKYYIYDSKNIGEIADGQLLYPTTENPNGKDILVEFSILLNNTMDMLGSSNFTLPGVFKSNNATTGHDKGDGLYFLYLTKGGMPKGAFEIWNSRQKEVAKVDSEKSYLYGPDCDSQNLYVGNFDGWHRIGVRIHSEAVAGASSATYINTVSLYIDGVLVQAYSYVADDSCSSHASDKRLFSTIWANKNLTEYENYDSRYITAYRYTTYILEAYAGKTAYIPIADLYYSCVDAGGDFVLDVSPVTNPEAKDFTQDGVTLSGREYFTVNN